MVKYHSSFRLQLLTPPQMPCKLCVLRCVLEVKFQGHDASLGTRCDARGVAVIPVAQRNFCCEVPGICVTPCAPFVHTFGHTQRAGREDHDDETATK